MWGVEISECALCGNLYFGKGRHLHCEAAELETSVKELKLQCASQGAQIEDLQSELHRAVDCLLGNQVVPELSCTRDEVECLRAFRQYKATAYPVSDLFVFAWKNG